jgi:regulator of protease activity HflC (stomatin/prohibitin superfamily)
MRTDTDNTPQRAFFGCVLLILAIAVAAFVVWPGIVALFSWHKTDGGHVAVVRDGGPFDDAAIRTVLPPSSPLTWIGLYSDVHEYPAQARYYDIVPAGDDRPGVNAYRTPTKDGVDVGLSARLNFGLNLDDATLRRFDDAFGTRTFAPVNGGERLAPWEGDEGFATWLDTVVKPIIEETLRQQVASVDCEDLQASCALVRNTDPSAAPVVTNTNNAETLQNIQRAVNDALGANINARLGGNYLTNIQFSLTGVDLPASIRQRIEAAQAEFAGASAAQARLNTARTDADTNAERQRGYNLCPTCAEIDRIKAEGEMLARIPGGVQVYAPGNPFAVAGR